MLLRASKFLELLGAVRPGYITGVGRSKALWLFSSNKEKQPQQIIISAQELEHIKKIVSRDLSKPVQLQGQASFFSNQQTQLSLQLMQITAKEQLKPHLIKYSAKTIEIQEDQQNYKSSLSQLLRCKFIILYKFINLGGTITDQQIQPIYQSISHHINLLGEVELTILYRLLAAEVSKNVQPAAIKIPAFPIIQNPTHTNSELVSLLLMVYPMSEEKVYINYYLVSKVKAENYRQGIQQPEREIIYDPVHLLLMLKHFFYYDDVQHLVRKCFEAKNIEQQNYALDELIKSQEQFVNRKVEALCFALNEGFHQICSLYLFQSADLLKQISIKHAIDLLKSVLTLKNVDKYSQSQLHTTLKLLLDVINNKQEALVQVSDDHQLVQNQNYINLVEILSIVLAKNQSVVSFPEITVAINDVFSMKGKWRINFQEYSVEQLFNLIVCYKGWKDLRLKNNLPTFDAEFVLFRTLLFNFREQIVQCSQVDRKKLFYVCYFADSFGCVDSLRCERIVDELGELGKMKDIKKNSVGIIQKILQKLNS